MLSGNLSLPNKISAMTAIKRISPPLNPNTLFSPKQKLKHETIMQYQQKNTKASRIKCYFQPGCLRVIPRSLSKAEKALLVFNFLVFRFNLSKGITT